MKVRLLVSRVGDRFSQSPGDIIDVDEAEAHALLASSQAEAVGPETASTAPPAAAMRQHGKPRRRSSGGGGGGGGD